MALFFYRWSLLIQIGPTEQGHGQHVYPQVSHETKVLRLQAVTYMYIREPLNSHLVFSLG